MLKVHNAVRIVGENYIFAFARKTVTENGLTYTQVGKADYNVIKRPEHHSMWWYSFYGKTEKEEQDDFEIIVCDDSPSNKNVQNDEIELIFEESEVSTTSCGNYKIYINFHL